MNEFEEFEAELQTLKPAKPPQEALDQLLTKLSAQVKQSFQTRPNKLPLRNRWSVPRWAVPAAAAVALVILLLEHRNPPSKQPGPRLLASSAHPLLKADNVEIDRQLIAYFDAVGQLPNGDPVRFRCQQWLDKVWLRDSVAGLVIERTIPRLEIIPVRMETY